MVNTFVFVCLFEIQEFKDIDGKSQLYYRSNSNSLMETSIKSYIASPVPLLGEIAFFYYTGFAE